MHNRKSTGLVRKNSITALETIEIKPNISTFQTNVLDWP